MTAPLSRRSERSTSTRASSSAETKKKKKGEAAPKKTKGEEGPANDGARTRTPTLASSLIARRAHRADPTTNQLRTRIEGSLVEGDAPSGEKRRAVPKRSDRALASASSNPERAERSQVKRRGEGFSESAGGSYTFRGTKGDDDYRVTQAANGSVIVVNRDTGKEFRLSAKKAERGVTIEAGRGDDRVEARSDVRPSPLESTQFGNGPPLGGLRIDGGRGDDRISARGSAGPVELRGGRGDDRIEGGNGDDTLEGGRGDDRIQGGRGRDLAAGGRGDDRVDGGGGNDQVLGQEGDDEVAGGGGHDVLIGGRGRDALDAGRGADAIYADADDASIDAGLDSASDAIISETGSVAARNHGQGDLERQYDAAATERWLRDHPELRIRGSDDFVARTRADLGVMLSTEQGRGLLTDLTGALRSRGETMSFVEQEDSAGGAYDRVDNTVFAGMWAERYPDGSNRTPLPVIFHEMVHGYQDLISGFPEGRSEFEGGRAINNRERQATGLSWIDQTGQVHPAGELVYSDNAFRRELGLAERRTYGGETGEPTAFETRPPNR